MRKKLILSVVSLLILLSIGVFVLLSRLDPLLETLKPQIIASLEDLFQSKVELGTLKASVLPNPAVEILGVKIGDDNSLESLRLKTSLFGLLNKRLDVSELALINGNVSLRRSPSGEIFLAGLNLTPKVPAKDKAPAMTGSETAQSNAQPDSAPKSKQNSALAFALSGAELQGLSVAFLDEKVNPPTRLELSNLQGTLSDLAPGSEGDVDLQATLLSKEKNNLRLSGTLELPKNSNEKPKARMKLNFADINLSEIEELLPSYGMQGQDLKLSDSATISADIALSEGLLTLTPLLNADDSGISFKDLFAKKAGSRLRFASEIPPQADGVLDIKNIELELADTTVNASVTRKATNETYVVASKNIELNSLPEFLPMLAPYAPKGSLKPNLEIQREGQQKLNIKGTLELDSLAAQFPMAKAEGGGASTLSVTDISGLLNFGGIKAETKGLALKLEGQPLSINATVENLLSPDINAEISSSNIKLGPVMKSVSGKESPAFKNAALGQVLMTLQHSASKNIGNFKATLGPSTLSGLPLSNVSVNTGYTLQGTEKKSLQRLTLHPGSLGIFAGTLGFNGGIENSSQLALALEGKKLSLEDISKTFIQGGVLSVKGSLDSAKLNIAGDTKNLLPTLSGRLAAEATKGEVVGFSLLGETLQKLTKIPGIGDSLAAYLPEKYRPILSGKTTTFDLLTLQATIANQALDISSLKMTDKLFVLESSGTAQFNGAFDLKARMKLSPTLVEEMLAKQPNLKLLQDKEGNVIFPVVISKSQSGPVVVLPEVSELLERGVKNTAKEAGKKALDKVAPGLGQALDSLF